jgi:fatty acid desaturase
VGGTGAQRIPDDLNVLLVLGVQAAAFGLLWAGTRSALPVALFLGVLFSFLLLTNYALLHEAAHDHLHSRRGANAALGTLAGALFPASLSLVRVTHAIHHCYNRTDEEIFDLYYPRDNMLRKYVQWYTPLLGFFWFLVPLGSILFGIFPRLLRTRLARISTTTKFMHEYFDGGAVRRVRLELLFACAYWTVLWHLLALDAATFAVFYGLFAFNWSTRQYVSHAYTRRDVVDGALNLKVSRVMGAILLNGQWDLVHHRKPWLPWTALPAEGRGSLAPVNYVGQYLRMWRLGMLPVAEPAPAPLPSELRPPSSAPVTISTS